MATQPTNSPVPSESPRDLKFNAGKIDEFVTSLVNTYVDRFGNEHYTIEGLRWLAQQAIAQYGWIPVGTFQAGATLTFPNQILKDTTDGEYYRWDGSFLPSGKVVPNGSTPSSSGGVGVDAWISVGDSFLRTELVKGFNGGYLKRTTVSEVASGLFPVGAQLTVTDRADGHFTVVSGGTPNGTYILNAGNGNTAVYQIPADGIVNVKALGGKSGVDCSQIIKDACSLSTLVHFPDKDVYEINFPVGANGSFVTYSEVNGVRITGANATIKDMNTYGVDYLTDIFKFVACKDVYINVGCDAKPLPDITAPYPNGIGYNGSAFVYLEGFCERVTVDSWVKNVRYGIRQGGYSNPSLGGANDIYVKLRCYQVGYPVAFYNAQNIKIDIDSNIQHRSAYITGCSNVRGTVAQAGFMYAAIGVLVADAIKTASLVDADRRVNSCVNVHINVVDRGSTGTQSNRAVCGITAAWKAPNVAHSDIHFHIQMKTNNAIRTLAGFRLENTVGWMAGNTLRDIKVSGVIDRSEQTLASSAWADFTFNGIEAGETGPYPNSPVFNGIDLSELQIINGVVSGNVSNIHAPNAIGVINLRDAQMSGVTLSINAPNTKRVLTNASFGSVSGAVYPALLTGDSGYRVNDDGTIDQWMKVNYNLPANTNQTFPLPKAFPSALMTSSVTPDASGKNAGVSITTAANITVQCSVSPSTLYIKASGY